jgi:hypothetical protein
MVTRIGGHEVEVIFELHHICPSLLVSVWRELENFMWYNLESSEKKVILNLLVQMFTEKGSDFAVKYGLLWKLFKYWYVSDGILKHMI